MGDLSNYAIHELKQHLNKSLEYIQTNLQLKHEEDEKENMKEGQKIWWWRWTSYNCQIQCGLQLHLTNKRKYCCLCNKNDQQNTQNSRILWNVIRNNIKLKKLYVAIIIILAHGCHCMQINLKFISSFIIFIILIFLTITLTTAFPTSTLPNYSFSTNNLLLKRLEVTDNKSDLKSHYLFKNLKRHNIYENWNARRNFMPLSKLEGLNLIKTDEVVETTTLTTDITTMNELSHFDLKKIQVTQQEQLKIFNTKISNNNTNPNSSTTESIISSTVANIEEEVCEAKVLDDIPTEPFYDFSDIAEDAAQKFLEFLNSKYSSFPITIITNEVKNGIKEQADAIASNALNEDDNLLAFALSAPSVNVVALKFRDNVTIPLEYMDNHEYLGSYWKELDYDWSKSNNGSQGWGIPFKDCNFLTGRWLWPFRKALFDSKISVIVAAFIAADEDVCNDDLEQIFGRKHGCDRNTTFCLLTENKPIPTRDVYMCICKESYYLPNSTLQGFRGDVVEMSEDFDNYSCIPCPDDCTTCDLNGVCIFGDPQDFYSLESIFKLLIGSILGACLIATLSIFIIIIRERKSKVIAFGMWTVLEMILIGILLLYISVAVHFFPASTKRCLLEPWLRELGFITCYGAIILKLYRHLIHFRTRKAHRWIFRDVDLLKYLSTMIFAVICYMSAFMASVLDLLDSTELESLRETQTNTCRPLKWDYVTQISEIFILLFGLYLAIISRNAITYFRERQFLVATLIMEFLVSSTFYLLRFLYLPEMSPSTILLVLFLRSQLTTTVALTFIFVPKLWYLYKHGSAEVGQQRGGVYAGLCLGDPEIGELTVADMSPEDICAELKRLYTQLEILKNKTLRQDNPHISKRRGGRKIGHRRFSLQMPSVKHRYTINNQNKDLVEQELSRTPEDSICSNEGPTDIYPSVTGTSECILP